MVYRDREVRDQVPGGYGVTITAIVVKPRARRTVPPLRSADPRDMPRVPRQLLGHPDDPAAMIAGQHFILRTFAGEPLRSRTRSIIASAGGDDADAVLEERSERQVKTNCHPS